MVEKTGAHANKLDQSSNGITAPHFFNTLIDAVVCPMYYKDANGIVIGCNEAFRNQVLGSDGTSITNKPLEQLENFLPRALYEIMACKDTDLLNNPGKRVSEIAVPCADGITRQFAIHQSTYLDSNDMVSGIVAVMLDISAAKDAESQLIQYRDQLERAASKRSDDQTSISNRLSKETEERQRAEQALLTSEELHRRVFENTGAATVLIDPDLTIAMANAKVEKLIGLARVEIVGKTSYLEFIEPTDRERLKLYHELRMQGKTNLPQRLEFKITDNCGNTKDLLGTAQWIPETRQVVVSMLDVTQSNEMQRERNRLAAVIEQSAEAVIITDTHGRVDYVNPAFEALSGFKRQQCVGQNMDAAFLSDQDRDVFKRMTFMVTGEDTWSGRIENQHRDGHKYITETHIFPICDDRGQAVNLVCVKTDITHEDQLEKQLQQAQKMEAIGTLAGGIAHDFNNILGGIFGYTEISMRLCADDDRLQRNFSRILDGCQRAKELVQNILTFSRKHEEETKPLEMQIVVKEALKLLRASIPSTVEFKNHITTDPSIISATATQIHQIIMNLCTNAAQAMSSDGGLLEVTLENIELTADPDPNKGDAPAGPCARLTIRDSGTGMDEQTMGHIFEPYYTTKKQTGGTGLGLSVVHGLVKNFGGTIDVNSQPGHGTKFIVTFPRIEDSTPASKAIDPVLPKASANQHILVVDDEEFILEIMNDMLAELGYRVDLAHSGKEALAILGEATVNYDLIIADLTMPKITGKQLAEQVDRLHPGIPIILTTGLNFDANAMQDELSRFEAVLNKPILFADLAATLEKVLAA